MENKNIITAEKISDLINEMAKPVDYHKYYEEYDKNCSKIMAEFKKACERSGVDIKSLLGNYENNTEEDDGRIQSDGGD